MSQIINEMLATAKKDNAQMEARERTTNKNIAVGLCYIFAAVMIVILFSYMPSSVSNHREIKALERRIDILESKNK